MAKINLTKGQEVTAEQVVKSIGKRFRESVLPTWEQWDKRQRELRRERGIIIFN